MLELVQVVLSSQQYDRYTFGKRTAGCCRTNLWFVNPPAGLKISQWPGMAILGLSDVNNHALGIYTK